VERKRLYELDPLADSVSGANSGIYTASANNKTYQRLFDLASIVLNSGYPVIIDAAFLEYKRRNHFQRLATDFSCQFLIVHCKASRDVLEARIIARARRADDPSEATLAVLNKQIEQQHTLTGNEPHIDVSDTVMPVLPSTIIDQLHPDMR
jgi:hypothetical protein